MEWDLGTDKYPYVIGLGSLKYPYVIVLGSLKYPYIIGLGDLEVSLYNWTWRPGDELMGLNYERVQCF